MVHKDANPPQTSIDTYYDPDIQKMNNGHLKSILMLFMISPDTTYTAKKVAKATLIDYIQVQRRMSEAVKSGKIVKVKNITEGGRTVSNYKYNKDGFIPEPHISPFEKLKAILENELSTESFNYIMRLYNSK